VSKITFLHFESKKVLKIESKKGKKVIFDTLNEQFRLTNSMVKIYRISNIYQFCYERELFLRLF